MPIHFDAKIIRLIMLLPNCLGVKLSSAKLLIFLSWCQTVRVQNRRGTKMSWCQIALPPNVIKYMGTSLNFEMGP